MKKIIYLIVLISFAKMGFCQFPPMGCQTLDTTSSGSRTSNCSMSSTAFHNYEDYYNTSLAMWKPNASDNVKIIKVNFIVVQKSQGNGGPGNFSSTGSCSSYTDEGFLNALITNVNALYANFGDPSDNGAYNVCGPCNQIKNSKIQFELEGIHYYVDDANYNTTNPVHFYNSGTEVNIILQDLTLNYDFTSSLPSYNYNTIQYIFLNRVYADYLNDCNGTLWGDTKMLAHELGHVLGLCHTHLGGGCSSSCQDMYNSGYYFDDVFGTYPGSCPDLGSWNSDPHLSPTDGITNNLMGNTITREYLSPKQIAVFHRDIALKSVRRYIKTCVYNSSNTLAVATNENWDFDMYLDRNLTITSGNTLTLQCKLSMADGAIITVNSGATLIIDQSAILTGACDDLWNGTLLVNGGGTLEIKNGAQVRMNGNGLIKIDASTQNANLIYDQGASILLNDNTTCLEIKGNLTISNNANFTFSGGGFVRFTSTANPSQNITAGTNASITLQGSSQTQKILEIQQESIYPPSNLVSLTLQNGKVVLYPNTRINPNGLSTAITVNNILLTSNTGAFNSHRGFVLFGQPSVSITNSIFQYGSYGIYAYLSYGGNPLTISNCTFRYCDKGLFTHDKGITLNGCSFNGNTTNTGYGFYAEAMSFPSTANASAFPNNKYGIYFNGATGSSFNLSNSSVTGNQVDGIGADGSYTFTALCNSISSNTSHGINMTNGVSLNVSQLQNPQGGYNNISGNGEGIYTSTGNLLYLQNNTTSGCNNFYTSATGSWDIYGYLSGYSCASRNIAGNNNFWTSSNGQPVWGTNYELWNKSICFPNNNVTITDPTPKAYQSCGGGGSDIITNNLLNPFTSTSDVRQITTASFNNVYISTAVQQAINNLTISNASGNNVKALGEFTEILSYPITNATPSEDWLLQVSYDYLKTAAGLVFGNNQNSTNVTLLQKVFAVQDKLIGIYNTDSNYEKKLYTTLDKALIYRLNSNRSEALNIINGMLIWAKSSDYAMLNHWICMIQTEKDILAGTIKKEDIQSIVESCNTLYGSSSNTRSVTNYSIEQNNNIASGDTKMEIFPNPFNESTTIKVSLPDNTANTIIELYNITGVKIKSYELKQGENSVIVKGSEMDSGIYYVVLKINQKNVLFNKLILSK